MNMNVNEFQWVWVDKTTNRSECRLMRVRMKVSHSEFQWTWATAFKCEYVCEWVPVSGSGREYEHEQEPLSFNWSDYECEWPLVSMSRNLNECRQVWVQVSVNEYKACKNIRQRVWVSIHIFCRHMVSSSDTISFSWPTLSILGKEAQMRPRNRQKQG